MGSAARQSTLPSWPVWVMLAGVALAVLGTVGAFLAIRPGELSPDLLRHLAAAPPILWAFVGITGVAALLFIVGMFAYVIVGSSSHERAERGYASIGTILACFGVAVVIANVVTTIIFLLIGPPFATSGGAPTPGALTLSVITLDGALLMILYFRIVRPGVLTWQQLGLVDTLLGTRVAQGLMYGVALMVGSMVIGALLQAFGVHQTQEEMFRGLLGATPGQFIGVLLAGAGFAPLAEETFFRGYVFGGLFRRWGAPVAFIASSLLFAFAHLNLQALAPLFYAGLVLAFAFWRTGSLVPGIIAHAFNNALELSILYFYHP